MKERVIAIFVGLVMIFSLVGYAMMSIVPQQQEQPTIPSIIDRPLSQQEKIFVLRTGRVLIENFYPTDCLTCDDTNRILETFAQRFDRFVVLEKVEGNSTLLQMIGAGGRIERLENITAESLFDIFCELAMAQPKECLLRGI